MQRPQPTHPLVPNWRSQTSNLCVSHWRYRERFEDRTSPNAHVGELLAEAARPLAVARRVGAVERDAVGQVVTEARRADHRAVRAGEAASGHLVPARVLAVPVERPGSSSVCEVRPIRAAAIFGDARATRPARRRSAAGRVELVEELGADAVPTSTVNPSSSSVSATSNPVEQRGPVPIETQKQVSPGSSQFTPIVRRPLAPGAVGGIGRQEHAVLDSIAARSQARRPTNA